MTITEIAREYHVSQQAVYQKMKRNGIKREDIQQPNSPQLTEEGERILRSLFNKEEKQIAQQALSTASELNEANKQIETLKKQIEKAEKERDALSTQIEQQAAQIQRQAERIAELEEERNFLRLTVSQEQQNSQKVIAALLPAPKERGLFAWFRKHSTKTDV